MSDLSAALAASMGVPEELVVRSATARAQAAGSSVDEVLAAWSGGGAVPASSAPVDEAPVVTASDSAPEIIETPPDASQPAPAPGPEPSVPAAPSGSAQPVAVIDRRSNAAPILVGRKDRPMAALVALFTLFVIGAIFAVSLPGADARSLAAEQRPNTTPQLSDVAQEGRQIYLREGCFYCHTQVVRSVVTDVGLGHVSEPGTSPSLSPETYGFQRIGPDLTHVGSREPTNDGAWLRAYLSDPAAQRPGTLQPSYAHLPEDQMTALVQFLLESE